MSCTAIQSLNKPLWRHKPVSLINNRLIVSSLPSSQAVAQNGAAKSATDKPSPQQAAVSDPPTEPETGHAPQQVDEFVDAKQPSDRSSESDTASDAKLDSPKNQAKAPSRAQTEASVRQRSASTASLPAQAPARSAQCSVAQTVPEEPESSEDDIPEPFTPAKSGKTASKTVSFDQSQIQPMEDDGNEPDALNLHGSPADVPPKPAGNTKAVGKSEPPSHRLHDCPA